jgi:predicted nucleic acid-binding protein
VTIKAYLDNNVVSAIAKDDTPAESGALDRLLVAYDQGKVELVTSELTLEEIKAYRGQRRSVVERAFRFLEKVPIVRWDEMVGMTSYGDEYTWINAPMIQNDQEYDALLALGLETVDAKHVFVAAKQSCDVFLTCDKAILRRASDIAKLCKVVAQGPSAFVASQGW